MTAPGAAGGTGRPALACVTGRFQPVHHDHVRLFRAALDAADRLVVAVTNPDPAARRPERGTAHRHRAEANPLTYYERLRLLRAALAGMGAGERSDVVPFDLTRPEVWRHYVPGDAVQFVGTYGGGWEQDKARRLAHAGYPVVTVPGDPARRASATDVRAAIRAGRPWEHLVPGAVAGPLRALLAARGGLDADPGAPAGPQPSPWAPPPPSADR